MLHISCNIDTRDLPYIYALGPAAFDLLACILGKSLMHMLQLLRIDQVFIRVPSVCYMGVSSFSVLNSAFMRPSSIWTNTVKRTTII